MRKKSIGIFICIIICLMGVGCNTKEKVIEEKSLIEYYQGNKIEKNPKISHICAVRESIENKYYVVAEATEGLLWEVTGDGKWEKLMDKPVEFSKYYLNEATFIDEDQIFCIFFEQKTEDEIVVMYYLISRDGTYKKINLEGIGEATDGFSDVEYYNGHLYGRNANGEVDVFEISTGVKKCTYRCEIYTNIYCIINDYIMLIGPKGAETYHIERKTRSDEWQYAEEKLYSLACEASSYPTRITYYDEKFYCITLEGIYVIDNKNQETITLVYGRERSFGDINVWLYDFSIHENSTFSVSMMNGNGESEFWIYKNCPEGIERLVLANEIVLYSLEYDSVLEYEISMFNAKKGNLYVEYKYGTNGLDSVTKSDAIKKLNTELLAGGGPDIILMDGIPEGAYVKKGVLMDISDVLSKEHFKNIANSGENSGEIYSIPRYFKLAGIMGNDGVVNEIENFEEFTKSIQELYDMDSKKMIFDLYFDSCYIDVMYRAYCNSFLENGRINEAELKKFYLNIKKIADIAISQYLSEFDNNVEEIKNDYSYINVESIDWMSQAVEVGDLSVAIGGITNVNDYAKIKSYCLTRNDISWDLYRTKGEIMYIPVQCFSISVNSNNIESAKEFLTYMISENAYIGNVNIEAGFPINQKAFMTQLNNIQSWQDEFTKGNGETVILPSVSLSVDEKDELLGLVSNLNMPANSDATLKSIIMEQAERYVNGEGSVEECVGEATQKGNIYLME